MEQKRFKLLFIKLKNLTPKDIKGIQKDLEKKVISTFQFIINLVELQNTKLKKN